MFMLNYKKLAFIFLICADFRKNNQRVRIIVSLRKNIFFLERSLNNLYLFVLGVYSSYVGILPYTSCIQK